MDATVIERAFRLQKALDSNHPFSLCIDNTAKKLISLITSNNKAPGNTKEESPIPDDALTVRSLLQDLDSLVNALYTGAAKSSSNGANVDAIRALLQEQINKYRDEMRAVEERVTSHEETVRGLVAELIAASSITHMEAVRALIQESESTQRESILGLGVRVNAFDAIGLKGLRKDMDDKLGSWQAALEHQHKAHTAEVNALREKCYGQINELQSAYKNTLKEFGPQLNAISSAIHASDEKHKMQQEQLDSKWESHAKEAKATVEALTKKVSELEARCEVLAENASYDDFEKLTSPAEEEQAAEPFEASDATAIMDHLKQLELNQNASIKTHLELSLTSTQMLLDSMRADMEQMDKRLAIQETECQFVLTADMVRDKHIKALLNDEINRWVADMILIGRNGCKDIAREVVQDEVENLVRGVAQDEAEKAIKYAIKSGRVMSRLAPGPSGPPPMVFPSGIPAPVHARPTNGHHPGYSFAVAPVVAPVPNRLNSPAALSASFNRSPSPNAAPVLSTVPNGTPTGSSVHLPPHLAIGKPTINPTAPAFTPTAPSFAPLTY